MPKSFSHGEASIVLQGFVIFLTNLYFKLIDILQKTTECMKDTNSLVCPMRANNLWTSNHEHLTEMDKLSTILQVGCNELFYVFVSKKSKSNLSVSIPDWSLGGNFHRYHQLFRETIPWYCILHSSCSCFTFRCTISNR